MEEPKTAPPRHPPFRHLPRKPGGGGRKDDGQDAHPTEEKSATMGYVYSNWKQQATLAEQVARGYLYVQELDDKVTATVSADGSSRDSGTLLGLRTQVNDEVERYAARLAKTNGNGIGTAHPVRFGG